MPVPVTPAPAPTIAPTAPTVPPPLPSIVLPDDAAGRALEVAKAAGLSLALDDLAREHVVLYALPREGVAYLLTPRRELKEDPKGQTLGALAVVYQLHDQLPPGTYVLTLDPTGEVVRFVGETAEARFPAITRKLPLPLPDRPVALITARQMCLAWGTLQVCAVVRTQLPGEYIEELQTAIKGLGASPEWFALMNAVPDVEGDNVLKACADALSQKPPDYAGCKASVLAVPAQTYDVPTPDIKEGSSAARGSGKALLALSRTRQRSQAAEEKRSRGVPAEVVRDASVSAGVAGATASRRAASTTITFSGALAVLTDLETEVFSDSNLTQPLGVLPEGDYLMYDIVRDSDPVIREFDGQAMKESRVGLTTTPGGSLLYYMPLVHNVPLIGEIATGGEPGDGSESVIVNLLFCPSWKKTCSCYFPWQQRLCRQVGQ